MPLISVSTDGNVKRLLRKSPVEFNSVYVRDFFAGDHTLVTLLEGDKRDRGTEASPPRQVAYFLSSSDHDGGLSNLVPLSIRFKPLKVAVFASGEILVLGWDEGNLLPELAVVREDGTIRRFVDLDNNRSGDRGSRSAVTLDSLRGAVFVSYGSELLLTYPGTTRPVRVLGAAGTGRTIPIALPGGLTLHDVLVSTGRGTLVVWAQAVDNSDKTAKDQAPSKPNQRLFEMSSYNGSLLREFVFDKPDISDVACAANSSLTAIFYDTPAKADQVAGVGRSRRAHAIGRFDRPEIARKLTAPCSCA